MPERTFTKDIQQPSGEVRWHAGQSADYPVGTWKGIERSLGVPLDDLSTPTVDAASAGVLVAGDQETNRSKIADAEARAAEAEARAKAAEAALAKAQATGGAANKSKAKKTAKAKTRRKAA